MKTKLKEEDYLLLLSCIERIYKCRNLEDFPKHILHALKELVPSQLSCYAEMDFINNRAINVFEPPSMVKPQTEKWMKAIHDHPVVNYFQTTGDGQAIKVSDFVDESELHQLSTYRNAFSDTGAEDQLAFGVQVKNRLVIGICFDRSERTFTERDRVILNLVRPHIIQVYSQLEELAKHEELQHDLQLALHANGLGLLTLSLEGEIVHATPGAWEKLATYHPVSTDRRKLPATLALWAFEKSDSQKDDVYSINATGMRLIVRRVRRKDERLMLFLSEEVCASAANSLAKYKLTQREEEVLRLIAEGKSNTEIARNLGVSAGTIKVHVERLLAKLGVGNRTAAAWMLRNS